jgi:hypothetical protein
MVAILILDSSTTTLFPDDLGGCIVVSSHDDVDRTLFQHHRLLQR